MVSVVFVDVDIGIDDVLVVIYLLVSFDVDLVGIVLIGGNIVVG